MLRGSRDSMSRDSAVSLWVKYTLYFTSFLLFLITGMVTAVGAFFLSTRDDLNIDSFRAFMLDWTCVLCLLASCLCVMSIAGWVGALREYRTCLLVFKVILGFFMLVEVVAIILIFLLAFEKTFQELVYDEDLYRKAIVKYRDPEFKSLQETIDTLQKHWKCCGVSNNEEGYKDWTVNQYFNCSTAIPPYQREVGDLCSVPYTCCKERPGMQSVLCGRKMADPNTAESIRSAAIYTKGCFLSFTEIVRSNILWIGIVSICIIIPEMFLYKLASDLCYQISLQRLKWKKHAGNIDRIT